MTQKYCTICGRMIFGTPRRLLVAEVDTDDNIQQIPGLTSLASCRWMCQDCYSRITMGILNDMIDKQKTDPRPKPEEPVKRKRAKKDRSMTRRRTRLLWGLSSRCTGQDGAASALPMTSASLPAR